MCSNDPIQNEYKRDHARCIHDGSRRRRGRDPAVAGFTKSNEGRVGAEHPFGSQCGRGISCGRKPVLLKVTPAVEIDDATADLISFHQLRSRGLHGLANAIAKSNGVDPRVFALIGISFQSDHTPAGQGSLHGRFVPGWDLTPLEVMVDRLAIASAALHTLATAVDRASEIMQANPGSRAILIRPGSPHAHSRRVF